MVRFLRVRNRSTGIKNSGTPGVLISRGDFSPPKPSETGACPAYGVAGRVATEAVYLKGTIATVRRLAAARRGVSRTAVPNASAGIDSISRDPNRLLIGATCQQFKPIADSDIFATGATVMCGAQRGGFMSFAD